MKPAIPESDFSHISHTKHGDTVRDFKMLGDKGPDAVASFMILRRRLARPG